ncbi:uncharacterized protein LOC123004151 [Tribolium madens]|uniref:uncharacterized protein LOC123004151 n=1 Tax=Tribolium madens TaxID=41895 RepID=UPI001CF72E1A|nr:uncharacterized protein LOC123004151 [Tribolium madens]
MTESVIKHYKKQLLYQHDTNEKNDFIETEIKPKIRRKRKNKICRGQFRHDAMELIKLGAHPSHSLCKTRLDNLPRKRKLESPPVVAAIDLTVESKKKDQKSDPKMPQLFLIKDLLAKGVRIDPKPQQQSVIVSTDRRESDDVDTISVSSGESVNPRRQIPHGKLFYYKNNNTLIRYFDETQKKLFIDSISSDGAYSATNDQEIIQLPKTAVFSPKDNLTVEEYVFEMTQVEKYVPRDFFLFYKFVTGYQICNNNLPVSFLTFLKVYNTNGLKVLLERYINSLKEN